MRKLINARIAPPTFIAELRVKVDDWAEELNRAWSYRGELYRGELYRAERWYRPPLGGEQAPDAASRRGRSRDIAANGTKILLLSGPL